MVPGNGKPKLNDLFSVREVVRDFVQTDTFISGKMFIIQCLRVFSAHLQQPGFYGAGDHVRPVSCAQFQSGTFNVPINRAR